MNRLLMAYLERLPGLLECGLCFDEEEAASLRKPDGASISFQQLCAYLGLERFHLTRERRLNYVELERSSREVQLFRKHDEGP